MMMNNIVATSSQKEKSSSASGGLDAKAEFKPMKLFNFIDIGGEASLQGDVTKKVIDSFEIKTTKSVILKELIDESTSVDDLSELKEGELVKVENVQLSLTNETELRTIKLMGSGAFKNMNVPGMNGIDFHNMMNSMFKDYAYKLLGDLEDSNEGLVIKIPLSFENEFESSYSVDDLFIGKVSIIGIYKGKVALKTLKNSFEYFTEMGNQSNSEEESNGIVDSQEIPSSQETVNIFKSSLNPDNKYHYLDLLAIIQNIQSP